MNTRMHIRRLYEWVKSPTKKDTTMIFYYEKEQLFLETDTLGVSLRTRLM